MINIPTVFILGAGASIPYGFPGGESLLMEISSNLISKTHYLEHLCRMFSDVDLLQDFGRQLRDSHQESVDAFLSSPSREDLRELGKAAIATSLLIHENPANLQRTIDDRGEGKWYRLLFRQLGDTVDQFFESQKNLSIITFNYDRSLEYFLHSAFKNFHNSTDDLIQDFIQKLPIIHVYGWLGTPHIWSPSNGVPYKNLFSTMNFLDSPARLYNPFRFCLRTSHQTNSFCQHLQ